MIEKRDSEKENRKKERGGEQTLKKKGGKSAKTRGKEIDKGEGFN